MDQAPGARSGGDVPCFPPDGRFATDPRSKHSVSAFYGAAVGRVPLDAGRVAPFVKLGAYYWKRKTKYQGEPCDGSVVDDEDVAPLVGVGADVAWNERWRMHGEWLGQTGGKAHAFLGGIAYRF